MRIICFYYSRIYKHQINGYILHKLKITDILCKYNFYTEYQFAFTVYCKIKPTFFVIYVGKLFWPLGIFLLCSLETWHHGRQCELKPQGSVRVSDPPLTNKANLKTTHHPDSRSFLICILKIVFSTQFSYLFEEPNDKMYFTILACQL